MLACGRDGVSCSGYLDSGDVDRGWGLGQPAADTPVVLWEIETKDGGGDEGGGRRSDRRGHEVNWREGGGHVEAAQEGSVGQVAFAGVEFRREWSSGSPQEFLHREHNLFLATRPACTACSHSAVLPCLALMSAQEGVYMKFL